MDYKEIQDLELKIEESIKGKELGIALAALMNCFFAGVADSRGVDFFSLDKESCKLLNQETGKFIDEINKVFDNYKQNQTKTKDPNG